jgi:hypothetical protein
MVGHVCNPGSQEAEGRGLKEKKRKKGVRRK